MTTFRNRSPGLPSYVAESGTGTTISPPFYCGNPLIYHAWMISIWVYLVTVPLPYNTVIIITDNNPGNKLLWTVQSLIWWRKSQFVLSPLTKPRKKKEEEKTKASLGRTDRHISSAMDSSTWDRDKSRDTSNGNPFSRQQRTVRVGAAAWRARPVYQLVAPANRRGVSDWGALQWRTYNFFF